MNIEKMREDFLVWHQAQVARLLEHGEPTAAGVWRSMESMYWEAWRASRESLMIELPASPYMPDSDPASMTGYEIGEAQGRCDMWASAREAIEVAGLKVKS